MKITDSDQVLSPQALERLISVLSQARSGDFSGRLKGSNEGVEGEVAEGINYVLSLNGKLSEELERVANSVVQGDLRARVALDNVKGQWVKQVQSINEIVSLFARHTAETYGMIKYLHAGDLNRSVPVGPETLNRGGDLSQLAEELNGSFAHLKAITSEVINILAQVGLDGNLSYQRQTTDALGSWGVLVGGLHAATGSLAEQVQELGEVAQAVAAGKLSARAILGMHGDLQPVKLGINGAAESMASYCAEVRRVAQEIVTEGKLFAALRQPGLRGEWQSSHDACNSALSALSSALRQIGNATKCIVNGEYESNTGTPPPGELGEPLEWLRKLARQEERTARALDSLAHGRFNEISEVAETERDKVLEKLCSRIRSDWINAARLGLVEARETQREESGFAQAALAHLITVSGAAVGALYVVRENGMLAQIASLGISREAENSVGIIASGESLIGKTASTGQPTVLDHLEKSSVRLRTGLVEIVPGSLLLFPVCVDRKVIAVLELAFSGDQASAAVESLRELQNDVAKGLHRVPVLGAKNASENDQNAGDEREELLIANARIEHLKNELSTRDNHARVLQTELEAIQKRLGSSAR